MALPLALAVPEDFMHPSLIMVRMKRSVDLTLLCVYLMNSFEVMDKTHVFFRQKSDIRLTLE